MGSFVLEMGLIYLVITKFKEAGERKLVMSILFVVGLNFITMGMAHGPLIATRRRDHRTERGDRLAPSRWRGASSVSSMSCSSWAWGR